MVPEGPRGNYVAPVGEALGFSAEDLEKNRAGELSPAQLEKLRREFPFTFGCMGVMALGLFGGCVAVSISTVVLIAHNPGTLRVAIVVVPLVLTVLSSIVFVYFIKSARRLYRDVRRPAAVRMEGRVIRKMEGEGNDARHLVTLGDLTLPLMTRAAYDCFDEQSIYRAFLSFHSRRFLSIEPIDLVDLGAGAENAKAAPQPSPRPDKKKRKPRK